MITVKAHLHDQFRRPRGPLGLLAGQIMSRRSSNVERNRWTVDQLQLQPDARVLELGYGPGLGIAAAVDATPHGHVVGLDHSSSMRAIATRRNAAAVRTGHAELLVGDAESPPTDLGSFDAIFCCNVWLFWPDAATTIGGLSQLLRPTGRLAITHLPRLGKPTRASTDAAAHQIEADMRDAGLTLVECAYLQLDPAPAVCVIGRADATRIRQRASS